MGWWDNLKNNMTSPNKVPLFGPHAPDNQRPTYQQQTFPQGTTQYGQGPTHGYTVIGPTATTHYPEGYQGAIPGVQAAAQPAPQTQLQPPMDAQAWMMPWMGGGMPWMPPVDYWGMPMGMPYGMGMGMPGMGMGMPWGMPWGMPPMMAPQAPQAPQASQGQSDPYGHASYQPGQSASSVRASSGVDQGYVPPAPWYNQQGQYQPSVFDFFENYY